MKKTLLSVALLAALFSLNLLGAASLSAHAQSDVPLVTGSVTRAGTTTNRITITVDRHRNPPCKGVQVSAARGPAVALLQTVPAIPGVTFQIAGQQYVTGADGTAAVMVPQPGTYDLQVITDTFHDPYRRVEFSRWLSETYQPTRQIHLPSSDPTNDVIQVGLNVYELVGQKFVDLQGKPVPLSRITEFSIRSLQGDAFTFHDGQPRWIPASRVTRRRTGGLEEVPLLYTVTDVSIDGSNVVNKAQQQFYPQPNATWTISLLLYSLRITAADALFGFPQGKQVKLQLPNGSIQTYPVDQTGAAQIYSLARGNYNFQVVGAKGLATTAPIALSKDQELDTKVISFLDLEVVAATGALLALALFIFGRLSLRRSRRRSQESRGARLTQA
jgi:hypothetical protein